MAYEKPQMTYERRTVREKIREMFITTLKGFFNVFVNLSMIIRFTPLQRTGLSVSTDGDDREYTCRPGTLSFPQPQCPGQIYLPSPRRVRPPWFVTRVEDLHGKARGLCPGTKGKGGPGVRGG